MYVGLCVPTSLLESGGRLNLSGEEPYLQAGQPPTTTTEGWMMV